MRSNDMAIVSGRSTRSLPHSMGIEESPFSAAAAYSLDRNALETGNRRCRHWRFTCRRTCLVDVCVVYTLLVLGAPSYEGLRLDSLVECTPRPHLIAGPFRYGNNADRSADRLLPLWARLSTPRRGWRQVASRWCPWRAYNGPERGEECAIRSPRCK